MEHIILLNALVNAFFVTLGFALCYVAKIGFSEEVKLPFKKNNIAGDEKAFVPGDDEDDF